MRCAKIPVLEGRVFYPPSALFPASTSRTPPDSLAREVQSSPLNVTPSINDGRLESVCIHTDQQINCCLYEYTSVILPIPQPGRKLEPESYTSWGGNSIEQSVVLGEAYREGQVKRTSPHGCAF